MLLLALPLMAEAPMFRQLRTAPLQRVDQRDANLTQRQRLDRWFPHHMKLIMGGQMYLTTPYHRGFRSDFFVGDFPFLSRDPINPIITSTFTDTTIVLQTGEVIPATDLLEQDFIDIKDQIAKLTIMFRSLGTPLPDQMIRGIDNIETFVIVNENGSREKVIFPSFAETVRRLNSFYQGYTSFFQFTEVIKMNSRLEFYGTFFIRNNRTHSTDFIDVRFHTNRRNEINLVMFFIYRDV
jgi:hypothetical protein